MRRQRAGHATDQIDAAIGQVDQGEVGQNLRSDRWAGADFWESQAMAPGLTLDQLLDRSEVVDVGIDGGGLDDLLDRKSVV